VNAGTCVDLTKETLAWDGAEKPDNSKARRVTVEEIRFIGVLFFEEN
jgi:hypothetical protein